MVFFFMWGKKTKQEIIYGHKINFRCVCTKGNKCNIFFNLSRADIFWIPVSGWKIDEVSIQCLNCGGVYCLHDKQEKEAIDLYNKLIMPH